MERVFFTAAQSAYMTPGLRERVQDFSERAAAWQAERERVGGRVESLDWITPATFRDGDAAVTAVAELRRLRLAVPVVGIALLGELEELRSAAMQEWRDHSARLQAEVQRVEAEARAAVDRLRISDAAKSQHVADASAEARKAAAEPLPVGESWHGWSEGTIKAGRDRLVAELREAVARAL